ncbi:HAD family hydrolase [Moraxella macacae 0408225]|uniref:HAD family hydrolase n=1 Tax=Moraxella macacae 0408225 TaxID=1230338 RepID=L2F6H6_9GAMM|nr:HAD family hydrolase [Moraxella macacae]ELA08627.1 HAD family hydrolase [Moraxella macacae 0408225]
MTQITTQIKPLNKTPKTFSKELAVFDLDHTLINTDSDYMWGEFLVKHKLVNETDYRNKNREFYEDYIAGTLDAVKYNEFVANFLRQHTLAQLHKWREAYILDEIAPLVRPKAKQALQKHRDAGHDVLVISATNAFVVKPIANQLFGVDFDHILATELVITNDGYTGKVLGKPNFKDGKIYHLNQWLANKNQQGIRYTKTYAYSDSLNDLPLLTWADVAICVSPDERLHAYARTNGWAVEDWAM